MPIPLFLGRARKGGSWPASPPLHACPPPSPISTHIPSLPSQHVITPGMDGRVQQTALVHEAWPGLQVGTYPCQWQRGTKCGATLGAAHHCNVRVQLMAPSLMSANSGAAVWHNGGMVRRAKRCSCCSGGSSPQLTQRMHQERDVTFPDPPHGSYTQGSAGCIDGMA